MHGCDVAAVIIAGILKGELSDAFACLFGDEFDALHHSIHNLEGTRPAHWTGRGGSISPALRPRQHKAHCTEGDSCLTAPLGSGGSKGNIRV